MLLGTLLMFLVLASLFTLIGINFWVRPKAAIERVTGAAMQSLPMTAHPSLAWHELVKKLGTLIPASPKRHLGDPAASGAGRLPRPGRRQDVLRSQGGPRAVAAVDNFRTDPGHGDRRQQKILGGRGGV